MTINNEKRFVYADNAATTPVSESVAARVTEVLKSEWGNPSSLYGVGRSASKIIAASRESIAQTLGCKANELYFTSCGSESDNWAIKGAAHANSTHGKHIITTKIEHHAVLNAMASLEREGFSVTYLDVNADGLISPSDVENAITDGTILIAVMYANNEIGSVMPIKEIAEIARKHKITMFTDAVQAVGNISLDISALGVDMLALSGHKLHAPKGIGLLYIRAGTRVATLIHGGGQERGKRGGTENTAYIAGLSTAIKEAYDALPDMERVRGLRDRLARELTAKIPRCRINGGMEKRLPGNLNLSVDCVEGESLVLMLDLAGIAASTGSACSSASLEPSHVLLAIGVPVETAHGSLRLTLSHENTDADVDYIIEKLPPIVARLREMSPLWNE